MAEKGLSRYAVKVVESLGLPARDREGLLSCLSGQPQPKAVVWAATRREPSFPVLPVRPGWLPTWADLVDPKSAPGQSPEHESGEVYVLDPSSVFESQAFSHLRPQSVLDLCASPGGKSVQAWVACRPEGLVCNEVIGKRLGMLRANLDRCNVPAEVVSLDVGQLASQQPARFDLVIVDAPCSGQTLLVRGKQNHGCFHPRTIEANAMRQRRILAGAAGCVSPGGCLAYMTCTFSQQENERQADWLANQFPEFAPEVVPALEPHRSTLGAGYRLWPMAGTGAGGYCCLLRHRA